MVQEPRRAFQAKRQSNFGSRGVNADKRTIGLGNACAVTEIRAAMKLARSDVRTSQPSGGCLYRLNPQLRLSWRGFAVCQNLSNDRRKVIDAGTWYDDAVAAAVSFFGYAQKSPAVVLPQFHVEMLALDLQFSRLDDVIHFLPEAADSTASSLGKGSKICGFFDCLGSPRSAGASLLIDELILSEGLPLSGSNQPNCVG